MYKYSLYLSFLLSICLIISACKDNPEGPGNTDSEQSLEISEIDPEEGPPGASVTISGSGFSSSASDNTVTFAGSEAEVEEASESELEAIVPDNAESGSVEVTVGDESASGPTFTVSDEGSEEVKIDSIDPESGPPGTEVTIDGQNFGDNPDNVEVYFSDIEASLTEIEDERLVAEVPDNAETGSVKVVVDEESVTGATFTVEEPASYQIQGTVVEEATNQGVEGVEVSFSNDVESVQTDGDGNWSVETEEVPIVVTVDSDNWDFRIHTRLVLGTEEEVNFQAHQDYSPPTDTRIVYQYREDCSGGTGCDKPFQIWTMDSNGSDREELTDNEGTDLNPDWSPDAKQIAFDSDRDNDSDLNRIWIMDKDGSDLTDTEVEGTQPDWSPDGEKIAFIRDGNIHVMEVNGGEMEIYNAANDYASSPVWSPDGSKIAFELRDSGNSETHIWVMEADGSNAIQLTDENEPNRNPAWEPSGSSILYASTIDAVDRLQLMDVDGANKRSRDWPDHDQFQPSWSPDGKEIVYTNWRMVPISNYIRWIPADSDAWMNIAPDSDAKEEFWANSPDWAWQ
ncbi:MAG: IPT/TIG domain-containing protein [Bacteroidota bacterium]